jgi:ATP-dependent Clp protease protease subunit
MKSYRIENAGSAAPELYLYGPIGSDWFSDGLSADKVVKDINALGKKKDIVVRIDSPGGNVFDGTNIYNALVRNPATITVHIDALAASIASVIAMAGAKIHIADNALMMIHEPYGMAYGTAAELRKQADVIDKTRENLLGIYVNRSQQKPEKVSDWMRSETWFNATEALQAGLATDIVIAQALAASASRETLSKFGYRNCPAWFLSGKEKPKLAAYRAKAGKVFRLANV